MYNVSNDFINASKQVVQEHRLTGTIGSISFTEANIIDGTFNIQKQSTDTNDVVLGSAYIGQLQATFTGISINVNEWIGKVITPAFGLKIGTNSWEDVPLGIYTVTSAKRSAIGVEVTAVDNMAKFDKIIKGKKNKLGVVTDSMYTFISLACTQCGVTLGMTSSEIDALPNGYRSQGDIEIYGDAGDSDFANDIETYRDLIYWCAQTMGCFATIDRNGQLVFKQYTQTVAEQIADTQRLSGAVFEDYITHYVGIYVTDMDTNGNTYYGYDATELQTQITETQEELSDTSDDLTQANADLAELEEEYAQGQITQQEYEAQKAVLTAQIKSLNKTLKQLEKRLKWLQNAYSQASTGDGADMDLGANPFLQNKNLTKRDNMRKNVLNALANISYTPFTCDLLCGAQYDVGDVLYFTGGHANNDFCCVMSWTYNHNMGTELQGFESSGGGGNIGINSAKVKMKSKAGKAAQTANTNAYKAPQVGVNTDVPSSSTPSGKTGDLIVNGVGTDVQEHFIIPQAWAAKNIVIFDSNTGIGDYTFNDLFVSQHPIYGYSVCEEEIVTEYPAVEDITIPYYFSFDAQFSEETVFANSALCGIGFGNLTRYVDAEHAPEYGEYYVDGMDGSYDAQRQVQSLFRDHDLHHYEGVCYAQSRGINHTFLGINFYGLDITNQPDGATPSGANLYVKNMRIIHYSSSHGIYANNNGTWEQYPVVNKITNTGTPNIDTHEEIAQITTGNTIQTLYAPKTTLKPKDSAVSAFNTTRLLKAGDKTYHLKSGVKFANMLNRGEVIGRRDEAVVDDNGVLTVNQNNIYVPRIPTVSKDVIPVMTGATTPKGTVSATNSRSSFDAYKAFDNDATTGWMPSENTSNPFLMYELATSDAPVLFDKVWIKFKNLGNSSVTIHANVKGKTFDALQNPWYEICTVGDVYAYTLAANNYTEFLLDLNQKDYYGLRIEFTDVLYSSSVEIYVAEVQLYTVVAVSDGSGGTTVIANPSGTASEDLEKIQIGNDIYSIPSGGGGGGREYLGSLIERVTQSVGNISGSSYDSSFGEPWKAFNGISPTNLRNPNNVWLSAQNETNPWIQYDFGLGNQRYFTQISIKCFSNYSGAWTGYIDILGSNDGTTWENILANGDKVSVTADYQQFTDIDINLDDTNLWRFIRLRGESAFNVYYQPAFIIDEIYVYGGIETSGGEVVQVSPTAVTVDSTNTHYDEASSGYNYYTRIGNLVTVFFALQVKSSGGATGTEEVLKDLPQCGNKIKLFHGGQVSSNDPLTITMGALSTSAYISGGTANALYYGQFSYYCDD